MEPFKIPGVIKDLREQYPKADVIKNIIKSGDKTAKEFIIRLWLSEGIPYAFRECPAIYESIRSLIAMRLDISPKDISLTGSARIGESLAPNKLGQPFDSNSDLDIFIVSENLFNRLKEDFMNWSFAFENGDKKPANETERRYWLDNYEKGSKNIGRGFIDSNKIPNHDEYKTAREVSQTMWLVTEKMNNTPNAPKVSKASVRCYKTWYYHINQVSLNLQELEKF